MNFVSTITGWMPEICRRIVVRAGLGGVLCCLALTGCDKPGDSPPVSKQADEAAVSGLLRLTPEELARTPLDTVVVTRGHAGAPKEFPATVLPNENELAEVTTLIRGRVVKVYVDVGADVKKHTLLALLHSTDLGMAEGAYLKAAAKLHEAELVYERAKDLHEHKAVSLAELQRREAEMRTAQAEARESQNRLELLGVPQEELDRLHRERTIKADVPLRAPFDGRVIMRNITRGEVVETQQKLFTVADLSDVWVVANVPEKDVHAIRKDQTVEVVAVAYPHAVFSGIITYLGDVLDPATRTMKVRVTAPNPDKALKPEMFALVRIHPAPDARALAIPLAALQNGSGGPIIFVQRSPREFEIRPVTVGREERESVPVLGGLQEGERVVTKGAFALKSEMERHKLEPAP